MVRLLQEGPLFCLLASMPATRTIRPTVVALLASATAPAAFPTVARAAPSAFHAFLNAYPPLALADLNAFPPSARADLNAVPPSIRADPTAFPLSAIGDFVIVGASALTSGFPILTAPLLSTLVDPVASQ